MSTPRDNSSAVDWRGFFAAPIPGEGDDDEGRVDWSGFFAAGELVGTGQGIPAQRPADATIELSLAELLAMEVSQSNPDPDEAGPTVAAIPIRNELAAARVAHALSNARDAVALIDEAVELLATVRDLHVETYRLGSARGVLRDTVGLLANRGRAEPNCAATSKTVRLVDLKSEPTYEELSIWMSFGLPLTS